MAYGVKLPQKFRLGYTALSYLSVDNPTQLVVDVRCTRCERFVLHREERGNLEIGMELHELECSGPIVEPSTAVVVLES